LIFRSAFCDSFPKLCDGDKVFCQPAIEEPHPAGGDPIVGSSDTLARLGSHLPENFAIKGLLGMYWYNTILEIPWHFLKMAYVKMKGVSKSKCAPQSTVFFPVSKATR